MLPKNACVGVSVAKSIFKLGGVATILSYAKLMHPSRYTLKGICCRFYQTGSKKTLQPAQKMIDELRQALNSGNAVDGLDIMERTSFLMNVNDTSIELVRAVLRKTIDVPPHQRSGNVSRLLSLGRHIPRGQLFSKFHADLVKHLAEIGTEEEFLELAVRLTPLISSENAELLFRMMCCRYIEVLPTDIIKTLIVESIGSVTVRRRLGISAAQISKLVESALAAAIWLNDTELIGNVLSTALSSRVRLHPVGLLEALNRLPEEWLSTFVPKIRCLPIKAVNVDVPLLFSLAHRMIRVPDVEGVFEVLKEAGRRHLVFSKDRCFTLLKASLDPLQNLTDIPIDRALKEQCRLALRLFIAFLQSFGDIEGRKIESIVVVLAAGLARVGDTGSLDSLLSVISERGMPPSPFLLNLIVTSVVNTADFKSHQARREAAIAGLSLFRQMTYEESSLGKKVLKQGVRPDVWSLNKIIAALARVRVSPSEIMPVIIEFDSAFLQIDIVTFTSLLGAARNLHEVEQVKAMMENKFQKSRDELIWCSSLFVAYGRVGYPQIAESYMVKYMRDGRLGNLTKVDAIHILLENWAKLGRYDKACEIYKTHFTKKTSLKPSLRALNAVITAVLRCSAICKKLAEVEKLIETFRLQGVNAKSSTWNLKMQAALFEFDSLLPSAFFDETERLFDKLGETGMIPTLATFTAIIRHHSHVASRLNKDDLDAREKLVSSALRWFEKMLGNGMTADQSAYLAVLDLLSQVGDVEAVSAWGHRMVESCENADSVDVSRCLVQAHLSRGDIDMAESVARDAVTPPPFDFSQNEWALEQKGGDRECWIAIAKAYLAKAETAGTGVELELRQIAVELLGRVHDSLWDLSCVDVALQSCLSDCNPWISEAKCLHLWVLGKEIEACDDSFLKPVFRKDIRCRLPRHLNDTSYIRLMTVLDKSCSSQREVIDKLTLLWKSICEELKGAGGPSPLLWVTFVEILIKRKAWYEVEAVVSIAGSRFVGHGVGCDLSSYLKRYPPSSSTIRLVVCRTLDALEEFGDARTREVLRELVFRHMPNYSE